MTPIKLSHTENMNILHTLYNWGDSYDRVARLYPGLLTILPILVFLVCVYGSDHPVLVTTVTLLVACGGPLFLSRIARDLGKSLEEGLNSKWGGKPVTILLRHRDTTIDSLTKKKYHRMIGRGIAKSAPTNALEARKPDQADVFYRAGTAWLISQTQDIKRHPLLFRENKHYGFQRNLRGLKWVAIPIALITLIISAFHLYVVSGANADLHQFLRSASLVHILPLAFSGVMLLCWIFFVTENSVRRAGFAYADRLVRACDVLFTSENS